MLADSEIRAELGKSVVIYPYNAAQVKPNSYDVLLGENLFIETETPSRTYEDYDIYDSESTEDAWKHVIPPIDDGTKYRGKFKGKRVYWLAPRERVLGHTYEFIGGKNNVTTMIKCRSSLGRSGISICLCAGSGDVGYINRWTLEITNHLRYRRVPLVVSEPVAQILFVRTGPCAKPYSGKYQESTRLRDIVLGWSPQKMLPRLWEDAKKWGTAEEFKTETDAEIGTRVALNSGPLSETHSVEAEGPDGAALMHLIGGRGSARSGSFDANISSQNYFGSVLGPAAAMAITDRITADTLSSMAATASVSSREDNVSTALHTSAGDPNTKKGSPSDGAEKP